MPFALDGEAVIELSRLAELLEKGAPHLATFPAARESTGVADYDEAVTGSGEKHVQPLGSSHESDIPFIVASRQARYYDLTFLSLVVVFINVSSLASSDDIRYHTTQ